MKNENPQSETAPKSSLLLTEQEEKQLQERSQEQAAIRKQQFKKAVIFSLMGLVFLGCMYLLFVPEEAEQTPPNSLDELIPQATNIALPSDKEVAYQQELLEQKQAEQRASLSSLSDYWIQEEPTSQEQVVPTQNANAIAHSAHTYRDMHRTLGNFYQQEDTSEANKLKEEIASLKEALAVKQSEDPLTTQMALMEKSYEMASKYLPQNQEKTTNTTTNQTLKDEGFDKNALSVYANSIVIASSLPVEKADSIWIKELSQKRVFQGIHTDANSSTLPKNSVKACVHTQTLIGENTRVQLRLLEAVRIAGAVIPKGYLLTATAKASEDRLQLLVKSIEYQGKVLPVAIVAYDMDGQRGLYLPHTPDANAFREVAASMSQSAGTNFTFNASAKEQILAETSKGILQGTSSYVSKKIARPKILLKAQYQLLLVSEK